MNANAKSSNKTWVKIIRELDTNLKLFGLIALISNVGIFGGIPLVPDEHRIYAFSIAVIFIAIIFFGMFYVLHKDKSSNKEERSLPKTTEENIPLVNGSLHGSLKGPREIKRLEIQSDGNFTLDIRAFNAALKRMSISNNIHAIDIGCGDGNVTFSRFSEYKVFEKVYGIDKDTDTVNKAILANKDKKIFDFRVFDVENDGLSNFIKNLDPSFHDGVDLIFCTLLLSHLNDPQKLVNKVKSILKPGGVVIFRGSDDGTKICYPNPGGLLEKVIDLTKRIPSVSDRENARKLYKQLLQAKFKNIETFYHVRDTVGKTTEERSKFYYKSFSYRSRYIDLAIDQGHDIAAVNELRKALSDLEDLFSEQDFYYMEMSYIFIASV